MNPDLERRLRQFGATVDAAAAAQDVRRDSAPVDAVVADLDRVVLLDRRRTHFYRGLAVAAAAVAVVAAGVTFALGRSDPTTETAEPLDTAPASHPGVAAADSGPASTNALDTRAATTGRITLTTSTPESSVAPPRRGNAPACRSYTVHNDYHLEICDTGAAVRLIQEGLRSAVDPGLEVDGYFGPRTRDAVRDFQEQHDLTVDGQVGPATWKLLVPEPPGMDIDGNGIVDPGEISTD